MLICVGCGCTETNACVTAEGPCSWASLDPPLCTACADGDFSYEDAPAPTLECAHSFLFTSPSEAHCVHCGEPFREAA